MHSLEGIHDLICSSFGSENSQSDPFKLLDKNKNEHVSMQLDGEHAESSSSDARERQPTPENVERVDSEVEFVHQSKKPTEKQAGSPKRPSPDSAEVASVSKMSGRKKENLLPADPASSSGSREKPSTSKFVTPHHVTPSSKVTRVRSSSKRPLAEAVDTPKGRGKARSAKKPRTCLVMRSQSEKSSSEGGECKTPTQPDPYEFHGSQSSGESQARTVGQEVQEFHGDVPRPSSAVSRVSVPYLCTSYQLITHFSFL